MSDAAPSTAASAAKEFTSEEVKNFTTREAGLYLIIREKVYDCTKFLDEHPGGEEVITDVAGQDATEPFDDVGHSEEAIDTLKTLEIGAVKRMPGEKVPVRTSDYSSSSSSSSGGSSLMAYVILLLALGAGYYYYQNSQAKPHTDPIVA